MEYERRKLFGRQQRQLDVGRETIDGRIVEFRAGLRRALGQSRQYALVPRDRKL